MENPTTTTTTEPSVLPDIVVPTEDQRPYAAIELPRRPYSDLFLISFLILFFELAAIRWFGSTVVFLTFFTNIVLLASFLGMSVGLLTATRRQNFIRWVLPLTFFCVALAVVTFNLYARYHDDITVTVGNQQKSPQLIYFGTEYRPMDMQHIRVPIEAVAGVFFALIAITFVGLGQVMGRAFDAISNRVLAYTTDVLGSLTGIAVFAGMSFLQLSPHVWFIVIVALLLYFTRNSWTRIQLIGALGTMFLIAMSAFGVGARGQVFWSPYYKVTYTPQSGDIDTNNIAHQNMLKIAENGSAYALPHFLNRFSGGQPFKDVMIIGAGSGNDVSAALQYGDPDVHVDAVEIDPMINQIGNWDHPDKPYADERVRIHLDDGRSFTRKTKGQYDLAIYALVDSLVLHSGYSSIRLENFLFTEQAFKDVKAKLKPGGVFAMYNYYRQGWVAARIYLMAKKVFGVEPLVIALPYRKEINPTENQANQITFVLVSNDAAALDRIRNVFKEKTNFWMNWRPEVNERVEAEAFALDPGLLPGVRTDWRQIAPAVVTTQPAVTPTNDDDKRAFAALAHLPQDNWPQLYLREKRIPDLGLRGMAIIGGLSIIILLAFAWPVFFSRTGLRARPSGQMFFLGAGFMLLETKGVVHMALLFGSTWIVNSVVFFAILVMILIANLFVLAFKPRKLWPYYVLLLIGLLANALVPMDWFLSLEVTARTVASCAVVFVPVFFAGVIFASSFRESRNPDVDFGSNVAGIILGGLSEQLSLMIGFNYLLLVAMVYYLLSWAFQPRWRVPMAAEPVVADETRTPAPALQGAVST
jgi:spermidine synthase